MTKICSKCKQEKDLGGFYNDESKKDGKSTQCKECRKVSQKRQYQADPEKFCARSRKYYADNTKSCKQTHRAYYVENAEEIKDHQREYHAENAEHFNEYSREYYQRTKEEQSAAKRKDHEKNPALMMWQSARKRAREANVPFALRQEDIIVPEFCPVFGKRLTIGDRKNSENSPSLDRLIPESGYVLGNVTVISRRANVIKNDGSIEEHRKIAAWINSTVPTAKINLDAGKPEQTLVSKARERAKKKGLICTLQKTDIFVPAFCPLLGIPLEKGKGKLHDFSPTLDRFINEIGYVSENVVVMSYRANRMKSDGTAEEHLKIADWMETMLQSRDIEHNYEEVPA